MAKECPICGAKKLRTIRGIYRFEPPPNVPGGVIQIAHAVWEECSECREQILGAGLNKALDEESRRRQGLLAPEEIRAIRERAGLSQTDIASLLGVGDKSYTRWETGKSIQNKSNDNLIRLVDQDPGALARLDAQRQPNRHVLIVEYMGQLRTLKGSNQVALAAHGAELDPTTARELREQLRRFSSRKTLR